MCDRRASGRAIVGAWPHDDDVLRPPCPGALDGGGDTTAVLRRARERFDRCGVLPRRPPRLPMPLPTPDTPVESNSGSVVVLYAVSPSRRRAFGHHRHRHRGRAAPKRPASSLTRPAFVRAPTMRRCFHHLDGRFVWFAGARSRGRARCVCVSRWCWSRRATARRWSRRAAATCTGGAATRTRRGSSGSTRSTRRRRSGSRTSPSTSPRSSPGRARRAASRSRT